MTERSERAGEPVGSLGEEAARLWDALNEWVGQETSTPAPHGAPHGVPDAPEEGAEPGPSTDPLLDAAVHSARGLTEALRRVDEHIATDDAECRYCPLCRVIHAVRETSPEVRRHLGDAAGSLLSAAAGLLADRSGRDLDRDGGDDDGGGEPAPDGPTAGS